MEVPVFCYGSYMDPQVLHRFGADPEPPARASVPGWRLSFTPHANLVQDPAGVAEGFVFMMTHAALDKLYGPNGYVTAYKPVAVIAASDGRSSAVLTFVEDAPEQAPDVAYLGGFIGICERLGLPAAYVEAVRARGQGLVDAAQG